MIIIRGYKELPIYANSHQINQTLDSQTEAGKDFLENFRPGCAPKWKSSLDGQFKGALPEGLKEN